MIVLDGSAAVDVLVGSAGRAHWVADQLEAADAVAAPHLIDVEVAGGVRRLTAAGVLADADGAAALALLRDLDVERYPHGDLLARMWELRHVVSAYDAAYVALAEALAAPLVTTDARLARTRGTQAEIRSP